MAATIRIYGKSTWPFTTAAREAYAKKDADVEYIDVLENEKQMQAMLKFSDGSRQVPVIVDGENISIGFNGRSWRVWSTGRAPVERELPKLNIPNLLAFGSLSSLGQHLHSPLFAWLTRLEYDPKLRCNSGILISFSSQGYFNIIETDE